MSVLDIFEEYCAKMTQISVYQKSMLDLARKELKDLNKLQELSSKKPELVDGELSGYNMSFYTARHRAYTPFGTVSSTIEDLRHSVVLHKNKQYQWLLAEAYEEFEDFLENIYAYAGYKNNGLWPLHDFGTTTLPELKNKSLEWYRERSKIKKDVPKSILNVFRNNYADLREIETNNALEINYRLAITLVESFRHVIVHKGGRVEDKAEFMNRVMKKSGLYNNGNFSAEDIDFVNLYFGQNEFSHTIMLLEVPTGADVPINSYICVFSELTRYMLSYAHLLCEQFQEFKDAQVTRK